MNVGSEHGSSHCPAGALTNYALISPVWLHSRSDSPRNPGGGSSHNWPGGQAWLSLLFWRQRLGAGNSRLVWAIVSCVFLFYVSLALPLVWLVPAEANRGCQALSLKAEIVNHPLVPLQVQPLYSKHLSAPHLPSPRFLYCCLPSDQQHRWPPGTAVHPRMPSGETVSSLRRGGSPELLFRFYVPSAGRVY